MMACPRLDLREVTGQGLIDEAASGHLPEVLPIGEKYGESQPLISQVYL
jgi:hypothetical protein